MDQDNWPRLKERLEEVFKAKTRDEWCEIMMGSDVCFAPVLSLEEATAFPHNVERNAFIEIDDVVHPAPAPRFSRTQTEIQGPPPHPGENTVEALSDWNFSEGEIEELRNAGAI